eukprot:2110025-Karenia_brevis.AAC.1
MVRWSAWMWLSNCVGDDGSKTSRLIGVGGGIGGGISNDGGMMSALGRCGIGCSCGCQGCVSAICCDCGMWCVEP